MPEDKKITSKYSEKKRGGVEVNHQRHPASGIPWCELCQRENRHS